MVGTSGITYQATVAETSPAVRSVSGLEWWLCGGRGIRLAFAVAAATVLVATGAVSSALAATVAPVQQVPGTTTLNDVACSGPSTCVAVGRGGPGDAVVVPLTDGTPGTVQVLPVLPELTGVACADATTCLAVGSRGVPIPGQRPGMEGLLVPITNGIAGTPLGVPDVNRFIEIACPSATTCYGLGVSNIDRGYTVIVTITNGIPGAMNVLLLPYGFDDIACVSVETCYAAGASGAGGAVMTITNGVPGPIVDIPSSSFLSGVACSSATTCYAVGSTDDNQSGVVVPITNGIVGTRVVLRNVFLAAISCLSPTTCEATGGNTNGSGRVVVPIFNGNPGVPTLVPGTGGLDGIACPTATSCVAVGASDVFPYVGVVSSITETGVEPSGESSLSCTPGTTGSGAPLDVCTVSDSDGLRIIRVKNTATNQLQASVAFACASAPTTAKIRVPAGAKYKVTVTDCDNPRNTSNFVIRADGTVNNL